MFLFLWLQMNDTRLIRIVYFIIFDSVTFCQRFCKRDIYKISHIENRCLSAMNTDPSHNGTLQNKNFLNFYVETIPYQLHITNFNTVK